MGTKPRTIRHYPRMKLRGRRRRRLVTPFAQIDLRPFIALHNDAVQALISIGIAAVEAGPILERFGQACQGSIKALERDPYLEALGREEPPAAVSCPVWFTWSAFGAQYPDTVCVDGELEDADDPGRSGRSTDPCPMHRPADFYEHHFGGAYTVPTCARCEDMLPTGTVLQWHELGKSISASAECPTCGKRTWTLMRDYLDTLGDDTPEWHPGELTPAAAE